jgi:hypothetical protein
LAAIFLPYIVQSRSSKKLLSNLIQNNYPILFEGLHTCYFLTHPLLKNRNKIVRIHNIEHEYYRALAYATKSVFKKIYFLTEAFLLKKYEPILSHAQTLFCINRKEETHYKNIFTNKVTVLTIPPFIPYTTVESIIGRGDYVLYHGNLSVAENEKVCLFLIKNISKKIKLPLILAGKNPTRLLKKKSAHSNIQLIENPSDEELKQLVKNAHINIVFSFQDTGSKLKLYTCLYLGRYCIANDKVLESSVKEACYIANTEVKLINTINQLSDMTFEKDHIHIRKKILSNNTNTSWKDFI